MFNLPHFIGISAYQAFPKSLNRRRLNEDTQSSLAIVFLNVYAALDIDIEHHILAGSQLFLHLTLERSVESAFVNLLVLKEVVRLNVASELFCRKKIIVHPILFLATRRPAGGTHAESQAELRMLLHQKVHYRTLSASRRRRNNQDLSLHVTLRSIPVP